MDSASGAPLARILLADDNADMRAYLTRLLSPHWVVKGVPDGATALAIARERPPDLVLSDVMMPGLDGFALLRALRADERTRTVPVMLLSARAGEEAAVEGLQAGADDYLVKPFTARELPARVAARLELTRLQREAVQHVGRLEAIIEAMADAVFIYDADGRITRMNTAARQMFALDTWPEYAALSLEERMRQVHPRDERGRPLAPDELPQRRMLHGEVLEGHMAMDIVIRALDGRDVQFNQSGAPVRDAAGNIIGAVAVCRDVTERRRLEQQIRWQARVRELALRETNRRMEEFLGIAGHELKTPVTVIKANIQLLSRAGQRNNREADLLHRSERQVDRLARLVEDLLDVSRISADKLELDRQPADLVAIIHDIVEGQRLAHPDRDISIKLRRRDAVPVLADADRIGQVLTNYLTNALKYSFDDRPVAVSLQVRDRTAKVSVRDEGPGIPTAEQQHIWEPFHRVEGIEVQSGSGVGLGLGLHISRTIVERHGGQVGVESVPGEGSTFWFTLPIAQPS